VPQQLAGLAAHPPPATGGDLQDLRHLPWSSIDNDTSRDLDQLEVAEAAAGSVASVAGVPFEWPGAIELPRNVAQRTSIPLTGSGTA
jgi:hypothetical protein